MRRPSLLIPIAIAFLILIFSGSLIHLITESWWFEAAGFAAVFWTRISWQLGLWVFTFVIYGAFVWFNYQTAMRLSGDRDFDWLEQQAELRPYAKVIPGLVAAIFSFLVAISAAYASAPEWETILKFLYPSEFGIADPIYQNDVGFYIFRLPLYQALQAWLLSLLTWGLVAAALVYSLKGSINLGRGWTNILTGNVKLHLSWLLAGVALLIALGFCIQRYELLYSSSGVVYGASYTDVHARLPAYWVMGFVTLALGVLVVLSLWRSGFALPTYGLVFYIIVFVGVAGLYPWTQQQFVVEPNELAKERPYISHNIEFTRNAYGLTQVESENYPAVESLSAEELQNNQATLQNVRLWDYRPLLSTYRQLQEIRAYYHFNDVDVDRYTLDGDYRQVMLAARELDLSRLSAQAQNWVNRRLNYTHGYGLAMSPVNVVTDNGLPQFFIQNIPPRSNVDLQPEQTAIYYGELTDSYILTGATNDEFDYPLGDTNATTRYAGQGGVPIGSFWRQLLYSLDLSDFRLFISNYLTSESRIHYHRNVWERVHRVAPFLQIDHDPYAILMDGRLQWVLDAYTTSDRYPYSEPVARVPQAGAILNSRVESDAEGEAAPPVQSRTNYIRNSVKVVVDAYDGTMQFFVVDNTDPVLQTYRRIFPTLFTDSEEISPQLWAHFRYPLDLFTIQALMYLSYHMENPEVFYNQEDLWRFPLQTIEDGTQVMEPYYMIMRLPNEAREEFVLILPFTPINRDNMIAWLAARSDGENYGRLLLYEFPKQQLVFGPSQIEARINQTPEISEQLTLWSQQGSRVIRGDLLVLPIEQSLLYVEPIYLRAEQGELPELRRVVVASANDVAMRPTFDEALAAVFGDLPAAVAGAPPADPPTPEPEPETPTAASPPVPAELPALINAAQAAYQRSQDALRQGNWSDYGRYQQELETLLNQIEEQTQDPATP